MKKHILVLLAFIIVIPFNNLNSQDWQPAELLDVTQCELTDGSIVSVAYNAQIGPGVGVERLDVSTYRIYFASDDIPTVQSPGQYDLYYVDFDIPSRSWGMAHSIDLICEIPLNSSSHDEQPRVSPDGQYLFYAQLGSGGSHDHEIWIAEKNSSGLWSNFRKLPPEVNAGYDEHSGGYRDGVLRFSAMNRNSNSGVFELWECDYDPVSNTASNPRKILFGTCPDQDQSSDPADTTIQHDALVDNSNDSFQWAENGINWNSADDGYISYAAGSWDAAVVSNVMFNPDDNPVMIFRIYRGTSSNHMGGFSNTGPSSTSFHYSDLDYGIYIHSTGSIRPTWNVNDSGYWSTTLPVGYYDIRVALDGTNQSVSIAVEQVSDYNSPMSDFQSPYWSTVESRSLDNSCYIQLNVGNQYTKIYDVWSTTGIAAPVTPAGMAGTDAWVIPDGSQLYFHSYLQPDAIGHDIYYSNKIKCPDGGYYWSNPIRMDDNVNGSGQETNPTPTEDMRFLFFSSTSGPANGYHKTLFCEAVLTLADLSGTVSIDDGVTSIPAEGVTLDLYRFTGTDFEYTASTTTGMDGDYSFAEYEPDSYRVDMIVPEGYETSSTQFDVSLAGMDITDLDFILNPLADIGGSVAIMENTPVAGHTIKLSLYDGTEYQYLDQTVTDSAGAYSFKNIAPGEYCIEPDSLKGHTAYPDVHYISLGRIDTTGVDFSFIPPADIAGTVSIDGSGAAQGVTVAVYRLVDEEDSLITETVTDENGDYHFVDLVMGDYSVEAVAPVGFTSDPALFELTLAGIDSTGLDFTLYPAALTNDSRNRIYWKFQAFMVILGKDWKLNEDAVDMTTYFPELIFNKYYNHPTAPIRIEGVTYSVVDGEDAPLLITDMRDALTYRSKHPHLKKAEGQYLTLLLNIVSQKVGQQVIISEDDKDVARAVVYIKELIDSGGDLYYQKATDIARKINRRIMIETGVISDGSTIYYKPGSDLPIVYNLKQNYPNPFNPSTTIQFDMPSSGFHRLAIYNVEGRLVKVISSGTVEAGTHSVSWNGSNHEGNQVSSGVYFYKLDVPGKSFKRKMVLLR